MKNDKELEQVEVDMKAFQAAQAIRKIAHDEFGMPSGEPVVLSDDDFGQGPLAQYRRQARDEGDPEVHIWGERK